jgi:hypothetical protein
MQASDPLDPRAVLGAAWQRRSPPASQARRPALTAPARDAIGAWLDRTMWRATSWAASLRNPATAVRLVINAIASSADSDS